MKFLAALVAWASIAIVPSISQNAARDGVSVQVQPGYGQGYGYGNRGGRDEQINVRCDCDDNNNYRRRGNRYGPTGFGNSYGSYNGYRQGAGYNQGYTGYNPNYSSQTQPGGVIIVGSGRTPYGK